MGARAKKRNGGLRVRGLRADRASRAHNLSGSGPARLVQENGRPMGAT